MSLDEFLDKQPAQPEDGIGLALSGQGKSPDAEQWFQRAASAAGSL